jgi:hypothetical protein
MKKRFWLSVYRFAGERLRRCAVPVQRPTVEELDAMLNSEVVPEVVALPNGSLIAV